MIMMIMKMKTTKKNKKVRLTPKKVQEFEKQLQENAQKPLGFFSFTNTEYAVLFVKKCDVSFMGFPLNVICAYNSCAKKAKEMANKAEKTKEAENEDRNKV